MTTCSLSILIPVYRYPVGDLVRNLVRQANGLPLQWEIRCYDDGSPAADRRLNEELSGMPGVVYRELPHNQGRAAVRNLLARDATGDYLLFMDADSRLVHPHYLQRFLDFLPTDSILCGGRVYSATPPADPARYLHWFYGRQREQQPAAQRRRHPHRGFMTNNFVIPRTLMLDHPLDETIRTYGHEDTLLGHEWERKGVGIIHLDNPLQHTGLEPADVFLAKQREAIANLYRIQQHHPIHTRALQLFGLIRRLRLEGPFHDWARMWHRRWLRKLQQERPPGLRQLDLLKLYWLGEEIRN